VCKRDRQAAARSSFELGARKPIVPQCFDELAVRRDFVLLGLEELIRADQHGAVLLKRESHDTPSERDHDLRVTLDDGARGQEPTSSSADLGTDVDGESCFAG
jgi:hypothetical protein